MARPEDSIEVYLVGGAVRDRLMGNTVKDRDWVVVNSTPDEMSSLGFRPIGKDFPVFLHPESGEQYALARTERKVARGYHGFTFHCGRHVTLEQDLMRRDLTINAMAMDRDGELLDPFGGADDISRRILRHVSDAFAEDPVRILRTARFAARFKRQDFSISKDTLMLMSRMVNSGESDALVPERVWQEISDALGYSCFSEFVVQLRACGALRVVLPEVEALFGVPQNSRYHPEVDTGLHTLMCLDAVSDITEDPVVRFAVLVHDLGKALTPANLLPAHHAHEKRGLSPIRNLCRRLGVPGRYRDFAMKFCELHLHGHRIHQLRPATVLRLLERLDGFRNPEQVERFIHGCLADRRGRLGHEQDAPGHLDLLSRYFRAATSVDAGIIAAEVKETTVSQSKAGAEIKRRIRAARIQSIAQSQTLRFGD